MIGLFTLALAVIILYVLSRIFIQRLFTALYRLTKSREKAAVLLGWIFLPGTFIHEIAHFITALFLIVPVGRINLMPEVTDSGIKLGSAEVGKTDFIRGSLIGLAPLFAGGGLILWAISFGFSPLLIYLIFELTHTMFSSKTDLNAVTELLVFVIIVAIALVALKINSPFFYLYNKIQAASPVTQSLSYSLLIPIGLELGFLALFRKV